jgi:hypothetical protein
MWEPDLVSNLDNLATAGAAYQRARDKAEQIMAEPRATLTEAVRAAYAAGVRKAAILRAIGDVWTRPWLDEVTKDIEPPGGRQVRRRPGE